MRTPLFLAFVAGILFGSAAQAQQVMAHFTSLSGHDIILLGDSSDRSGHRADKPVSEMWPWCQGDLDSFKADYDHHGDGRGVERDEKFCTWLTWYSTDCFGRETLGECGYDGKDQRRWPGWKLYLHRDPSSCSPIPEPPISSALIGLAVFGLVLRARRFRLKRLS